MLSTITDAKATMEITGKAKSDTEPGIHNASLEVYSDNTLLFAEEIPILLKIPLYISIQKFTKELPSRKNWPWMIVILAIFIFLIYVYLKSRKPSTNKKTISSKTKKFIFKKK